MTGYHYCALTKPEADHQVGQMDLVDMENVDYKRQPDVIRIASHISTGDGLCCGIFRGGMFGLATNQVGVFSTW